MGGKSAASTASQTTEAQAAPVTEQICKIHIPLYTLTHPHNCITQPLPLSPTVLLSPAPAPIPSLVHVERA